MRGTTSFFAIRPFSKHKVLIVILILAGIVTLLIINKTLIMRVVSRNATAFHLIMKVKQITEDLMLKISHHDQSINSEPMILPDQIEIVVDLNQNKGRYRQFWGGIGYNSFRAGTLNRDNQKLFHLMAEVNKKNPDTFNYVRAFNIFTNGNAVTPDGEGCEIYSEDAQGQPQFNWTICDQVFDYVVSLNFDLIVAFTLMPVELASNKSRLQPWFGGNMSPPLSHEKWARLVYETTNHFVTRYGLEKVSRWYFEVWNEPDLAWLFWIPDNDHVNPQLREWGDMDAYNKLYDYTAEAVKRVHPDLRVGGPVVAGTYIEPLLEHLGEKNYCTGEKGTAVDFLSFHSYGSVFEKVIRKIDEIHQTTGKINKQYQRIPLIVSEFSPSAYDTPWFVTRYPALWLIATVDAIFNYADQNQRSDFLPEMMIYWTGPVIKEFGQHPIAKSTDGLATTLGNRLLKLPVFNAFEMLGFLSNDRVSVMNRVRYPDYKQNLTNEFMCLLQAMATQSDSTFEVLIYQFTENDPFCNNQKKYQVRLNIENIPDKKFYLRKFVINEYAGDVFMSWRRLHSPMTPTEHQLAILDDDDDLKLAVPIHEPDIQAGCYREQFDMSTNEAILLVFSRQDDHLSPLPPEKIINKEIGTNAISLVWQTPKPARDKDSAAAYAIYQNQQLVARTVNNHFVAQNLTDDMNYDYEIYSLDDQGNMSERPLHIVIKTARDNKVPEFNAINIYNLNTFDLTFNESLDSNVASNVQNYQIDNGVEIKSVTMRDDGKRIQFKTTPHQNGRRYCLRIQELRDRARRPNVIKNFQVSYDFHLGYTETFDVDHSDQFIWERIWEQGGLGGYQYDTIGRKLKVVTGDDIGQGFSHPLPETERGTFQIDFQPIINYPSGGKFLLRLKQDDDSYYQVELTHGYGAGHIKKIIQSMTVDSISCNHEFQQGLSYCLRINFSPDQATLSGFQDPRTIAQNKHPIRVKEFEIELMQQDAYFDNIIYRCE